MNENTVLQIVMKFLVDKNSQKAATSAVNSMGVSFDAAINRFRGNDGKIIGKDLANALTQAGAQIDAVAAKAQAMNPTAWAQGGAELVQHYRNVTREALVSAQAAGTLKQGMEDTAMFTRELSRELDAVATKQSRMGRGGSGSAMMMGMTGFTLAMTGAQIAGLGKSVLSPISGYTERAGLTTESSARYTAAQQSITNSINRIGGALTGTLAPMLEDVAKAIADAAKMIEDNPGLAKAIGYSAVGAVGTGTALSVLGGTLAGLASFKSLSNLLNLGGFVKTAGSVVGTGAKIAGQGALAAGKAAVGNPVLMGVGAGVMGYDLIAKANDWQSAGEIAGKTLTVIAYKAGGLFGPEKAAEWGRSIGVLTGALQKTADKAEEAAEEVAPSMDAVKAFVDYRKAEAEAETKYSEERNSIVEDYAKERVSLEAEYESQRSKLVEQIRKAQLEDDSSYRSDAAKTARDRAQDEAREEEDYYNDRRDLLQDYQVDIRRMEEDFQRRMRQARAQHLDRVADLEDERDAMGIWREMRDYERERKAAQDEHNVEMARRNEDLALRLAEMDREFALARARRMQDYAQQRADAEAEYQLRKAQQAAELQEQLKQLAADHKLEMKQLETQKVQKLSDLQKQYNEERLKRQTALADQLRDLDEALLGERGLRAAYYQAMSADLQNWLKTMQGQLQSGLPGYSTKGSRAAGGYVSAGLWNLHDDEYVLSRSTVSALENGLGGRITQSKLLAALTGTNQRSVNASFQFNIQGDMSAGQKAALRKELRAIAQGELLSALR